MAERSNAAGSCFCGAVRFEVELPGLFCGHCHCSMCRRSHGSPLVTWFAVPRARFALRASATLQRFASSDHGTRSFCATCGSTLFCESARHPSTVDIVLANMDDAIDRNPESHAYFDSRATWVEVSDGLPRLGGESGVEPLHGEG